MADIEFGELYGILKGVKDALQTSFGNKITVLESNITIGPVRVSIPLDISKVADDSVLISTAKRRGIKIRDNIAIISVVAPINEIPYKIINIVKKWSIAIKSVKAPLKTGKTKARKKKPLF